MKAIYIFLNRRISGIDGSIQYIYNKSGYLKSKGYEVLVFSVDTGRILVKDFEKYRRYIIPDMRFCPSLFRNSERKKILSKALSMLSEYKDSKVVIESTSPVSAVWGEMMARELHCKHVYFHLMEKTELRQDFRKFCRFKYDREELAGITDRTVRLLLADDSVEPRMISAYCNNVFSDREDSFSDKLDKEADYTIGSIGRLEKPYVPSVVDELVRFFKNHEDLRFNFILIGGDGNGKAAQRFCEKVCGCNNVRFLITDYLYPIPLGLINNIDIFVSTAGSASATYCLGKPTIKVHPITGASVGIIGCDFKLKEKSMYESSDLFTIEDCIERIIKNKAKIFYEKIMDDSFNEVMDKEFERQLNIALSDNIPDYYDSKKLEKLKTPFKQFHICYVVICHIIGGKGLRKVIGFINGMNKGMFRNG